GAMPQANVMYSPNKNIRYQQTWHTIEFSNNKHSRHHTSHPVMATASLRSNFSNLPEFLIRSKSVENLEWKVIGCRVNIR
ncbi:hypothetical protein ACFFPK_07535, partial [Glutamicibacter nicotianae]|uniref:hypothetical protein n=1 Tax=Glutamicibacter nicotianae TaxID=37929 RepID=UPI0035E6CADD